MKTSFFAETKADALAKLAEQAPAIAARWAPIYQHLNWTWGGTAKRDGYVPREFDIMRRLMDLIALCQADKRKRCEHSTGGISVWCESDHCGVRFEDDVIVWL